MNNQHEQHNQRVVFGEAKQKIPLIKKIRREAQEKYDNYPPGVQEMYRNEVCAMGGEHLTVRQLNRCILMEVPPVCLKHYKQMQGQIEKLAPLFNQLTLL